MDSREPNGSERELAHALVEELLRTGLVLTDTLALLIEQLPDDAFPGEDNAAVLVEMTAGSCASVVQATGEATCRQTLAVIAALRDRFVEDLKTAAKLASAR
jgi:hypothetical protein